MKGAVFKSNKKNKLGNREKRKFTLSSDGIETGIGIESL